jgi:type II secretory pathway pseudopilin PulG
MQRRAFTLLETLVALIIIVASVGGALLLSRAVATGSQASEDTAQAEALAEEGVAQIRHYVATLREAGADSVATFFGGGIGIGSELTVYTVMRSNTSGTLTGAYRNQFCFRATNADGSDRGLFPEGGVGSCTDAGTLQSRAQGAVLSTASAAGGQGELIYLRQQYDAATTDKRWYAELATLNDTRSGVGPVIANTDQSWDTYRRTVTMRAQPSVVAGADTSDLAVLVRSIMTNTRTGISASRQTTLYLTAGKVQSSFGATVPSGNPQTPPGNGLEPTTDVSDFVNELNSQKTIDPSSIRPLGRPEVIQ